MRIVVEPRRLAVAEHNIDKEFFSSEELQRWLGIGKTKTFALLNDPIHGIPNYRIGRRILIRRRDAEDWLEQNRYH
jgi:excisionase family DNA binding protein